MDRLAQALGPIIIAAELGCRTRLRSEKSLDTRWTQGHGYARRSWTAPSLLLGPDEGVHSAVGIPWAAAA